MARKNETRLTQTLTQTLSQQINMQAVALGRFLSMSEPEFEEAVRHELDENPALEAVDAPSDANDEFSESADEMQRLDYNNDDDMPLYLGGGRGDDAHVEASSYTADDGQSPVDILMQRMATEYPLDDYETLLANYIIGSLDDNGYLTRPIVDIADDIAIAEGVDPQMSDLERIYGYLRSLDPAGIGARDLRDCMLLQLERLEASDSVIAARKIVADHFDLLSKRHFDRLEAQSGFSRDQLAEAMEVIRSLNPKPASAISGAVMADRTQHVVPDFLLTYDAGQDAFSLALQGSVPELQVEETFQIDSAGVGERHAAANSFIRSRRNTAQQFIRLVNLRSLTLMAIGKAIVARQRDFFISGDKADIKPMVLRDIESDTGLDQSVISRATSGKYILTPLGIYPLKLLFNEGHGGDSDMSTHRILKALTDAINAEDKNAPLSDQALTDMLVAQGYDVARRTVAKYRERLGFPIARLRRQL